MHDAPLPSRSRVSDPAGKCDVRVETAVPESVKGDMAVYWRLLGFGSEAEYVRSLIVKDLYGSFSTLQSIAQRAVKVNPGNPGFNRGE